MSSEYDDMKISPQRRNLFGDYNARENEKIDMFVPDRILVVGQDKYFGTTAPPRELRLENSVRPPDPGMIRVETPPRVISLSEHNFPTVGEDDDLSEPESLPPSPVVGIITPKKNKPRMPVNDSAWDSLSGTLNGSELVARNGQPGEEINHLRRQMAKLNRRVMALELDSIQKQQRDKYLLAVGLGYYLIKFLFWLNK